MEWVFIAILVVSVVHVLEEYFGGFVEQVKRFIPEADISQFISVNMMFLVMCLIAVIVGPSSLVFSLSVAAVLFINVFFHLGGAIRLRGYSGGLASALLLYLPVSAYAFYYYWNAGALTATDLALAVLLGAFWMVLVFVHELIQISVKKAGHA